jgi:hypothetical protein
VNDHLLNFTKSFRNQLFNQIYESLGMMPSDAPIIVMNYFSVIPDVSISRAFDSHINMQWILFPMYLFRNFLKDILQNKSQVK